jgi:hypothetical protein
MLKVLKIGSMVQLTDRSNAGENSNILAKAYGNIERAQVIKLIQHVTLSAVGCLSGKFGIDLCCCMNMQITSANTGTARLS